VFGEALRRRAMAVLGDIGVPVKYGHEGLHRARDEQAPLGATRSSRAGVASGGGGGAHATVPATARGGHARARPCSSRACRGGPLRFPAARRREPRRRGHRSGAVGRKLVDRWTRAFAARLAFGNGADLHALPRAGSASRGHLGRYNRQALVRRYPRAHGGWPHPRRRRSVPPPDGSALRISSGRRRQAPRRTRDGISRRSSRGRSAQVDQRAGRRSLIPARPTWPTP
jgi:hypothetical protein